MKYLIVLVTLSCAIGFSESISRKRIETIMLNILDCKTIEGYVEVDMKTILTHKVPKRYIDKCLAACLTEIGGVMKDRNINPDGLEALARKAYGDDSRVEKARGIANACVGITDEDRCDAAYKIFHCLHEQAHSQGLSADDL